MQPLSTAAGQRSLNSRHTATHLHTGNTEPVLQHSCDAYQAPLTTSGTWMSAHTRFQSSTVGTQTQSNTVSTLSLQRTQHKQQHTMYACNSMQPSNISLNIRPTSMFAHRSITSSQASSRFLSIHEQHRTGKKDQAVLTRMVTCSLLTVSPAVKGPCLHAMS